MKVYSLKAGIEEVIKHFEEEKLHESAQAMESIQRLKQLIST
jgi:predicted transcriptional regulator